MAIQSQPRRKSSPLKWVVAGAIVGAALYWGVPLVRGQEDTSEASAANGALPVSVSTVVSAPVTPFREFSGRLEAVNAAEIRPRVSGQIMAIHFTDGQDVKRGQLLFTIDPRPFEAELLRAKGALAAAESAAVNARQDLKRAQQLMKSKVLSQAEFDARTSAAKQAEGNLASAQGAVKLSELNIAYAHITAPIAGKISRAEITIGNQVEAGGNAPLLASIVTVSPIYASFDLDEQTYLNTMQGLPLAQLKKTPVEILLADGQTPVKGSIHAFDNQITAGSGTLRVRALVANKDGTLVPGLFARVRLGTPQQVNALLINPAAVGTDQNKKFVYVVAEGNKAEYREVKLGAVAEGLQIVESGLNEGEKLVVSGLQRLRPGAPMTPIMVDMKTLKPEGGEGATASQPASVEKAD